MTSETAPPRAATAAVVGGGPGGLMAAEVLASAGLRVTVFEHMPSVGRKFLLAGRSGLNLSHSEPIDQLLARYGTQRPRLEAAVRAFDTDALRAWSASLGEPTFIGTSGRVFPESLRATPLLRSWLRRLDALGVTIEPRNRWIGWSDDGALLLRGADRDEREVAADVTVFALGGASWPRVGSDGRWVDVFRTAGIAVRDLRPANCGVLVDWAPEFAERHAGAPVKNIALSIDGVSARGDLVVTAGGMEGGPVYALSAVVRQAVAEHRRAVLSVDLQPDLSVTELAERLGRRRPRDSMSSTLKRTVRLTPTAIAWLREVRAAPLPSDIDALASLLKAVPCAVDGVASIDRAISTAGGVLLDEVDDTFMLRRMPGTYVVGEMLDWEAPTGGYLLHATFATAVAAANGALASLPNLSSSCDLSARGT